MLKTGWNCFLSSIEMNYRENNINFYQKFNDSSIQNQTPIECRTDFMESFSSINSLTSKQEFLKRMRYLTEDLFNLINLLNFNLVIV